MTAKVLRTAVTAAALLAVAVLGMEQPYWHGLTWEADPSHPDTPAPGWHALAQVVQTLVLSPTDRITDTGSLELDGARGIAIFEIGERTYAAVAAYYDDGVQILDLTDPGNISATDQIDDTDSLELDGAADIDIFEIGERTYAAVAAYYDDGVQILDLTDPGNIRAAGQITDTIRLELYGARGIDTFEMDGRTYAVVAGHKDHGVQILNLTDPGNISATDQIDDTDSLELYGARGIATFEMGGRTYAAVSGLKEGGIQMLDLTDPGNAVAIGRITGDGVRDLVGPAEIATFKIGERIHAAVADNYGNSVQILDLSQPGKPEWSGQIGDTDSLELYHATGITTFKMGERTYAAAASWGDNGVQVLDLTDPDNIGAVGQITDTGSLELGGALDVAVFKTGGLTYAAVTGHDDDGVQIIGMAVDHLPAADAGPDQTVLEGAAVTLRATASGPDGDPLTYGWSHDHPTLNITLADPAALATTFTAPQVSSNTTVTFTFTATDPRNATASDAVTITILDAPAKEPPPSLNFTAVLEPTGTLGPRDIGRIALLSSQPGTINATWAEPRGASDDPPANYRISWTKAGESFLPWTDPAGNAYPTEPSYDITGLEDGEQYEVKVRASYSGRAGPWSGELAITVAGPAADNRPPTADAGPDRTVMEGDAVTLDAIAYDPDPGDTLTYGWSHDRPGLNITLADPAALATTFTAPQVSSDTALTLTLRITDGYDATASDAVTITVLDAPAGDPARAGHFVTTWRTTEPGESITIPVGGASGTYTVDWGDGTVSANVTGSQTHAYDAPGIHIVGISGDFARIYLNGQQPNANKLASIEQWGDVRWESMKSAFAGASNMVYRAADAPDLSGVTDMYRTFSGASSFDGDLSGWDVSSVTDMQQAFRQASSFDGDLSGWDVSSVTDMHRMFSGATSFNGDLSGWNVSSATDMQHMFDGADAFDQNLGNWYIVLDGLQVGEAGGTVGTISAQNAFLAAQEPTYGLGPGGDSGSFEIVNKTVLKLRTAPDGGTPKGSYAVTVTSTGDFGTGNSRTLEVTPEVRAVEPPPLNHTAVLEPPDPLGPRDIGRISLASFQPGTINATWVEPRGASDNPPANYRISWTKAGESFLPWTDPAGNAYPTEPSYDITGLEEGGQYKVKVRASYSGKAGPWSGDVVVDVARSPDDHPPAAYAGPDRAVQEGSVVPLNGTASDPDGDPMTYSWSHDHPTLEIAFANATSPTTTFTAPQVAANTTLTLTLTVDDGDQTASDSATVTIIDATSERQRAAPTPANPADNRIILLLPPTVSVGPDLTVDEGSPVSLSGITVHAGDQPTYRWTHDSSLDIVLRGDATPAAAFTAPSVDSDTTVTFTLTITDQYGATAADTVDVTVLNVPPGDPPPATIILLPPTVSVGPDLTVDEGSPVSLSGITVHAGDQPTYRWTHDSALDIALTGDATPAVAFTAPAVDSDTTIAFTLTITDQYGATAADTVDVTVLNVLPGDPPAAPANLRATATDTAVTLIWDDPDDDTITGYKVLSRMALTESKLYVLVADTGSAAATYTVDGLNPDTIYVFRVVAVNGLGESGVSNFVRLSTLQ